MGSPAGVALDVIGSYRFDDPDGRVGMETFPLTAGDTLFQVPLTYRDEPLEGVDAAFIAKMEHSELGTRWVYDGLGDPRYVLMLFRRPVLGSRPAIGLTATGDGLPKPVVLAEIRER